MAKIRTTSKGPALDLTPTERAELAGLVSARMSELDYQVQDAASATTLSPATIRAWFREATGTTTVTLWALVALCRGLGLELAEVAGMLGVVLDPKAIDTAQRNYRQRRARNGQPAEPPMPTRRAPAREADATPAGGSLRELIEAIVDERVEQRLAELLTA